VSSSWPPPPDEPTEEQPAVPHQPPTHWQPAQPHQSQQPPTSWQPAQPQPAGWQPAQPQPAGEHRVYPQQALSDQEVKPGRNRKPLYLGLLVALVLLVGGVVAWQLLKDDGEDTRAAYCSALKTLTNDGDLTGALGSADASSLNQVAEVQRLAPDAVRDDWDKLQSAIQSAQSGNVDFSNALNALTSLRAISDDAGDNCGITMDVPGLR
jgi:hypothetical protein